MIATLLLSQGVPMLLGGDELGNSQNGNNNVYCQDNEIGWTDWNGLDDPFLNFCKGAIAFRKAHPVLKQERFLTGEATEDGTIEVAWYRPDGAFMDDAPGATTICGRSASSSASRQTTRVLISSSSSSMRVGIAR